VASGRTNSETIFLASEPPNSALVVIVVNRQFHQLPGKTDIVGVIAIFRQLFRGVNMSAKMMNHIGWVFLALLALIVWFSLRTRQNRNSSKLSPSAGRERSGASVYLGLRDLALQGTLPKNVQDAAVAKPGEPFAVLMDWGIARGTATVAAYSDGTASVYLSSGGGFLGGGQAHESIRSAAIKTVGIAGELKGLMHPTTMYPLPQPEHVTFYVRTSAGVLTATVLEGELRSHRSPLYKLGDSAQTIITEYRLTQDQK